MPEQRHGHALEQTQHWSLSLEGFLFVYFCLWEILVQVSREGISTIFISLPDVFFNMLILQHVWIESQEYCLVVFFFLLLLLFNYSCMPFLPIPPPHPRPSLKRDWDGGQSAPRWSGKCKLYVPKCLWLEKTKTCDSLAGCKLLKLFGLV